MPINRWSRRSVLALASAGAIPLALAACSSGAASDSQAAASDSTLGTVAVADSAPAAPNTLTDAEKAAGWRLLWDGHDFEGWRGLGMDSVPTEHWKIVDGAIYKVPSGDVPKAPDGQPLKGADLITKDTFKNFELSWDWKISPGGNSGLKYNVDEALSLKNPTARAALGLEYQMLDDDRHPDGKLLTHRAGALYDLIPPDSTKKHLAPVGEWNHSRIVFNGNHGEHWLNGEKVVDYDLGSARMDSAFAKSKWHDMPEYITRKPESHIVLQDHNDAVWVRNVKIREIK
jgi:hypothetical protein